MKPFKNKVNRLGDNSNKPGDESCDSYNSQDEGDENGKVYDNSVKP